MRKGKNSSWQMATRDDSRVAKALYRGKVDRAHTLEEDALRDEFFGYLRDIGALLRFYEASKKHSRVWDELEQFKPQKVKRVLVPLADFFYFTCSRSCLGLIPLTPFPIFCSPIRRP